MNMQMVTDIGVIIGCILMLFSALAFNVILWEGYIVGRKIKEKTYQLGKDLTPEKVEDYIQFIDSIEIPPRKYHYDRIQAGYEIINLNINIPKDLVGELRVIVLSKGILVG